MSLVNLCISFIVNNNSIYKEDYVKCFPDDVMNKIFLGCVEKYGLTEELMSQFNGCKMCKMISITFSNFTIAKN